MLFSNSMTICPIEKLLREERKRENSGPKPNVEYGVNSTEFSTFTEFTPTDAEQVKYRDPKERSAQGLLCSTVFHILC